MGVCELGEGGEGGGGEVAIGDDEMGVLKSKGVLMDDRRSL